MKPSRLDRAKLLIQSLLEQLARRARRPRRVRRHRLPAEPAQRRLRGPARVPARARPGVPARGRHELRRAARHLACRPSAPAARADRYLIILSDGEATRRRTGNRTRRGAQEKGHPRHRPRRRHDRRRDDSRRPTARFVKDERGAVVLSKLESATLQELAPDGRWRLPRRQRVGRPVRTGEAKRSRPAARASFVEKNTVRLIERFQWPLALGLWCLFVSFCSEFPVRPRPRDVALAHAGAKKSTPPVAPAQGPAVTLILLGIVSFTRALSPVQQRSRWRSARRRFRLRALPRPRLNLCRWPESSAASLLARSHRHAIGPNSVAKPPPGVRSCSPKSNRYPKGPSAMRSPPWTSAAKLDAKATDWPKLRDELEALLQKPDEEKQDKQKQQDDQDKNDQQQNQQDQKQQDQKSDPQRAGPIQPAAVLAQDQKDSSRNRIHPAAGRKAAGAESRRASRPSAT